MRRLVLVGRPNAGKSSVYNALTGGAARVGNFPGVTVSALHGEVIAPDGAALSVVDLPGIYTLREGAESGTDEAIARDFLGTQLRAQSDVLAFVLDATQLEHGLRLLSELTGPEARVLVLLTQADLLEADGRRVDTAALSEALGVPVQLVNSHALAGLVAVWPSLTAACVLAPLASWDARVLAARVSARSKQPEHARSGTARLDAWLLHPVAGPVAFACVMGALFAGVFAVADPVTAGIDAVVGGVRALLVARLGPGWFTDLLSEGVFGGAGTLLGFVPQIALLSAGMALLDASGYLARASLLAHAMLGRFGLSGRAFAPLLMGHACAIPAIAATRTIRDPKERMRTLMVLPLTTCSARIPTYALVIQAFFGGRSVFFRGGVFLALYTLGVTLSLLASWVLAARGKQRGAMPIAIEFPRYRAPRLAIVARTSWRASLSFVRGVGGMVLVASCLLWGLLHVRAPLWAGGALPGTHGSVAASLGRAFEPLTHLCGFDWRINVGLIGSFGARELMVSTLGVVFGASDTDASDLPARIASATDAHGATSYSAATGLALLVFFVIACQCSSTVAALKRETTSWRVPLLVLAWTYTLAFGLAVVTFQTARLFV